MTAKRTPSYRRHAPSGQAVVTLNGRDFYLGPHGSQASKAEYDRLLGEWLTKGRVLPHSNPNGRAYTVAEIMAAFLTYAGTYYRKHGKRTGAVDVTAGSSPSLAWPFWPE